MQRQKLVSCRHRGRVSQRPAPPATPLPGNLFPGPARPTRPTPRCVRRRQLRKRRATRRVERQRCQTTPATAPTLHSARQSAASQSRVLWKAREAGGAVRRVECQRCQTRPAATLTLHSTRRSTAPRAGRCRAWVGRRGTPGGAARRGEWNTCAVKRGSQEHLHSTRCDETRHSEATRQHDAAGSAGRRREAEREGEAECECEAQGAQREGATALVGDHARTRQGAKRPTSA
jgi:hypothetical protein